MLNYAVASAAHGKEREAATVYNHSLGLCRDGVNHSRNSKAHGAAIMIGNDATPPGLDRLEAPRTWNQDIAFFIST